MKRKSIIIGIIISFILITTDIYIGKLQRKTLEYSNINLELQSLENKLSDIGKRDFFYSECVTNHSFTEKRLPWKLDKLVKKLQEKKNYCEEKYKIFYEEKEEQERQEKLSQERKILDAKAEKYEKYIESKNKVDKKADFTAYFVDDFSDEYYGKIYFKENSIKPDSDYISGKGYVSIYNNLDEEIISVGSKEETFEIWVWLNDGKIKSNTLELPYGRQDNIIYKDFNFDGVKDLAIQNEKNSCYGGPAFDIYIKKGEKFIFDEEFSKLAQEYCGMFDIKEQEKEIHTMTKSGCCWHEYSRFIIENNKPKKIYQRTESVGLDDIITITTEKLINGKWEKTEETRPRN